MFLTAPPRKLFAVTEFLAHAKLPEIYKQLGFAVTRSLSELQVGKAVSMARCRHPSPSKPSPPF